MVYFLTSSPFQPDSPALNPANGFVDHLMACLPRPCRGLFICSDPDLPSLTDRFGGDMRAALETAGLAQQDWTVLDRRNQADAARLVAASGLIVLAGGHVPTQNRFFQEIRLRKLLAGFDGVLIGISAGSMNSADTVYAQPEREGEAISPAYRRFLPGLGLTNAMLLPHYQQVKNNVVDGLRAFEDIAYPDSMGRVFYAIPDGSYLLGRGGTEALYGEAYRIADGQIRRVCEYGGIYPLTLEKECP